MTVTPEPLSALLGRYSDPDDVPLPLSNIRLAEALAGTGDPLNVLPYLAGLGIVVRTLDDLLLINNSLDEEEIHSFRVQEGVVVAIASHGTWLLFTP